MACHDSTTLDWYTTNTYSTPTSCTDCHAAGFSAALDPVLTNATPPSGRHVKHVTESGIACEGCHSQYPLDVTHANGVATLAVNAYNVADEELQQHVFGDIIGRRVVGQLTFRF